MRRMLLSKLLEHPVALCNQITRLAIEAGEKTLDYFDESGFTDATRKEDGSPVTIADQAAEDIIEAGLRDITPDIPIVGEEATSAGGNLEHTNLETFWLVDPLDGTKEFVSGSGEYTVNIGLIHKGKPIMGVIVAPYTGEVFTADSERGARRINEDGVEKSIHVRTPPARGLIVIASRSHAKGSALNDYLAYHKVDKIVQKGSSLKLCHIAAGKADLYPRFGPTCEWDIAAGQAILEAAGGILRTEFGKAMIYGKMSEKYLNPGFIAASHESLVITP